MMLAGERQIAPNVSGIRRDHVARYEWAAKLLPAQSKVVDFACGVGYGTHVLARAGHHVVGVDGDAEAIEYARVHYGHSGGVFQIEDVSRIRADRLDHLDSVVCFETIEHIENPLPLLQQFRGHAKRLIASVPNEEVFPHGGRVKFHFRHYTRFQFDALLRSAGWQVIGWYGQRGPESEVEENMNGRTLIAVASPCEPVEPEVITPRPAARPEIVPKHVAIVALGPSVGQYLDLTKGLGSRRKLADEVWAINALGDVLQCDRVFHMDDVRIQEARAAERPNSSIAAMLEWLRTNPGPIYTSRAHPDYPGLVEFPLEDVINDLGYGYFNNTAAYAVAYAIHIGVERISLFGVDFTYPNAHDAEKGRGCVEYWLGFARARGIELLVSAKSSLLDGCEPERRRLYGYDTVDVDITVGTSGAARVSFSPRSVVPSADEIEARYDHSKHPNPLVAASQDRAGQVPD